jgi:hypothetical protein
MVFNHTLQGLQDAMAWRMQLGVDIILVKIIGNPL